MRYENFLLISFLFVLSLMLSSCDNMITGNVVKSDEVESISIWCSDGITMDVADYCVSTNDSLVKFLAINAGYGTVDSMQVVFYHKDEQKEKLIDLGLEPTHSRVYSVRIPFETFDYATIHAFYVGSDGRLSTCSRPTTIAIDEFRECAE
ncbi:MAG: hypothetical protein ACOCUR_02645 [Nanoarchaeota archaeon]